MWVEEEVMMWIMDVLDVVDVFLGGGWSSDEVSMSCLMGGGKDRNRGWGMSCSAICAPYPDTYEAVSTTLAVKLLDFSAYFFEACVVNLWVSRAFGLLSGHRGCGDIWWCRRSGGDWGWR